jgi:hypothetical protein
VMDCWLLPSWDQGWRPWRLKSWTVVARMWLYLAYAVVGRLLPSFGLRHRVCASHAIMMIRLRNGWCGLRAMPRMLVYRGYGTASRGARALGLRRPESIDTLPSPDFA